MCQNHFLVETGSLKSYDMITSYSPVFFCCGCIYYKQEETVHPSIATHQPFWYHQPTNLSFYCPSTNFLSICTPQGLLYLHVFLLFLLFSKRNERKLRALNLRISFLFSKRTESLTGSTFNLSGRLVGGQVARSNLQQRRPGVVASLSKLRSYHHTPRIDPATDPPPTASF